MVDEKTLVNEEETPISIQSKSDLENDDEPTNGNGKEAN